MTKKYKDKRLKKIQLKNRVRIKQLKKYTQDIKGKQGWV